MHIVYRLVNAFEAIAENLASQENVDRNEVIEDSLSLLVEKVRKR